MRLVTIDLDAYDQLPPRQLRAMLRALRFADTDGVVCATLTQLAMPGLSRSAIHRDLAELERAGGRYRIPDRFLPVPAAGIVSHETVPEAGTTDSRAPASKNLSLSLDSLEREKIPASWEEAAATERRRAGLPDVDLDAEWRKHILWFRDRDRPIRLGSWLLWALRARLDHTNAPNPPPPTGRDNPPISHPGSGTDQDHARARSWARTGRWAPPGIDWGPAPDQPGCALPPALIAWCREERRC